MTNNSSSVDPSVEAQKYIENSNIDVLDLSVKNVEKADELLRKVYAEWRSGEMADLVAYEIGCFFEGEPIHYHMSTSVYPLCDIWFHLQNNTIADIKST